MNLKSVLSAATVASLLIAPVAAQAGTVASKSVLSKKALSASGQRRAVRVKADQNIDGSTALLGLLGAGAIVGGVIIATDDNKSSGS